MSGNLTESDVPVAPTSATAEDGVAVVAVTHLKPIKYPVRLNDVAIIGRKGSWQRTFMLRPKYGGRFLFLMYPSDQINLDTVIVREVNFQSFNSAPQVLDIRIPKESRHYWNWNWRLVKTHGANEQENEFEIQDSLHQLADGFLYGESAAFLAREAEQEDSLSHLIYETRPSLQGQLKFSEEIDGNISRIVAWSCHQPFDTENGSAVIWKHSEAILHWYKGLVEQFDPHRVWALGDTSYSDGTGSLNFVKQVDGKTGWHHNWDLRKDLLSLYRLNYRYHWSFEPLQTVMCNYPHLSMWDDHEIRDGFGSDQRDFSDENQVMKAIASQAAEDYQFSWSLRLRSEAGKNVNIDNHQAYVDNPVASFIFDGRNSRNYGEDLAVPADISFLIGLVADFAIGRFIPFPLNTVRTQIYSSTDLAMDLTNLYRWHNPGEVVSDQQLDDFSRFCNHLKGQPGVKYLLMGNSVPFIYVMDFIETIAAEAALTDTSLGQHIRDDIRDSWHSPANRRQLGKLLEILRDLHHARPDIEIINISGDIHISNAFIYQPEGFNKPLYQVTSSALTNRVSISEGISNLMSIDGPLSFNTESSDLGEITRLWHEGTYQNFLSIDADENAIKLHLHVFNKDDDAPFGSKDQTLTIKPGAGYSLA